ncbi:MAG: hypothetical protein II937_01545 [Bacteroidales bacterium]|nr:hypothetical protein [Bacteroidales bacterium]
MAVELVSAGEDGRVGVKITLPKLYRARQFADWIIQKVNENKLKKSVNHSQLTFRVQICFPNIFD